MWALSWLPNWVFHLMLILGIVISFGSWFMQRIPGYGQIALPAQILGILITVVSVWYEGGIAKDREYELKLAKAEERILVAEKHAAEATAKVEYKFLDKVQVVKEVQVVVKEKIRDIAVKIDSECKVAPEAVRVLNDSARNIKPEITK